MKNKKLYGLLLGLLCMVLCVSMLLIACDSGAKEEKSSQDTTLAESDPQGETTAPDVTQPLETEPAATEPVETEPTEPEVTEPTEPEATEPTEPEETEPADGETTPNTNTGTGGGYTPGTSDPTEPTEPEDVTEPEIVVPTPGSENNAYTEYFQEPNGQFNTVSIPAGRQMYYRVKTAGSYLQIRDEDASVVYNGTTYLPVEGVIDITLPGDGSQPFTLIFENKNAEDKAFTVAILDSVGSKTNPIVLDSLQDVMVSLQEGDADGVYYQWVADKSGRLNLNVNPDAGVSVEVTTRTGSATLVNGKLSLSVNNGEEILIQVMTEENGDGIHPGAEVSLDGYVAVTVDLTVTKIPSEVETVTIPGGESVIYRIRGVWGRTLTISNADFRVLYDGVMYTADENGDVIVKLPAGSGITELEIFNDADAEQAAALGVNFYAGHELNPQNLVALGELEAVIPGNQNGYYFTYQAEYTGLATFLVWTYPEIEGTKVDIQVTNQTTGEYVALWDDAGNLAEDETVSVQVNAGDALLIRVSVTDITGASVESALTIYGALYGNAEQPIHVGYPGFTASVPAGETLYYAGYNMGGLILSTTGENLQIAHNGVTYTPVEGAITFDVVAEGRDPAVFAITNLGTEKTDFIISFAYPVGHMENPAALLLGTNVLTQSAGASDYYYTFTAPRAGTITLKFDGDAQWVYAVDNMTQGIYGDTQWSDSDPLMTQMAVTVNAKDVIRVRVNTYDAANMFETPAGTVTFTADYVSGPTEITNFYMPTTATLLPGEGAAFTGNFYGYVLRVTGDKNSYLIFNGVKYTADSTGTIKVDMPAAGTEMLSLTVYNGAAVQTNMSLLFSTNDMGTVENPEKLTLGSHSMVQSIVGGGDYYYQFVAEKNGRLTITFETDVNAIFIVNNNQIYYTHMGKNQVTINVRPGAKINLVVNTYDPANPMVSPIGTVDFTVELK